MTQYQMTSHSRADLLIGACDCMASGEGLERFLDHLDTPDTNRKGHTMMAKQILSEPIETYPVYKATDLTEGGDQARIQLGDQLYTLRITRAGKLILTK